MDLCEKMQKIYLNNYYYFIFQNIRKSSSQSVALVPSSGPQLTFGARLEYRINRERTN